MKAFLLAAGIGTRLRPLTDDIPKCLLPIAGKPLLEIWFELLGKHGVKEALVNTHWRQEKVDAFVKQRVNNYSLLVNGKDRVNSYPLIVNGMLEREGNVGLRITNQQITNNSLKVRLFYEPELLGSAGTVLANRNWVADGQPFFILYGDNLTNVDMRRMYKFHLGHGLPFTLGVVRAERPEACGIAEVDKEGVVTGFVEKPVNPKSDLAAAGVYMADQRIFDFFPEGAESRMPLDLGFHVIPRLVGRMKAYFIEEFLMDIGTADSYEKAQEIYPQIAQKK